MIISQNSLAILKKVLKQKINLQVMMALQHNFIDNFQMS